MVLNRNFTPDWAQESRGLCTISILPYVPGRQGNTGGLPRGP